MTLGPEGYQCGRKQRISYVCLEYDCMVQVMDKGTDPQSRRWKSFHRLIDTTLAVANVLRGASRSVTSSICHDVV